MGLGSYLNSLKFRSPVTSKSSIASYPLSIAQPISTYISTGTPVWRNFAELIYLLNCYYENPIVNAIINVKAEAFANIRFKVQDLKSGEIIDLKDYQDDGGVLNNLLKKPNPRQTRTEWLRQLKVNDYVFGDAYVYASLPVGFENSFTYEDIAVLNNLPSYNVCSVLTGKWLDATTKEEIINKYVLTDFNGKKRDLHTNSVLHLNNTNIKFDANFTNGKSKLLPLKQPISNIDKAFESKNVLITKRGALGILSSDMKDEAVGSIALNETQIEEVQKAFNKYGLMRDQYSQIISPVPLKYQKMAMSVKDLMLFEEVSHNAIAICNSYGVPEELVRYYIRTGTLGSDSNISEKRFYDSTIIPESVDFINNLNNFLNTEENGILLIGSYDHLHVLQANKKEEAEVNKLKCDAAKDNFMSGLTNYGQYAIACGVELENKAMEKKMVWDLDDRQLSALGIGNKKTETNEQ